MSTTYPQRKAIRLRGYNYASAGHYFVTIVTHNRGLLFEDHPYKDVVDRSRRWLAEQHSYVELDQYIVMPNHLHGIVVIRTNALGDPAPKTLGRLTGAFKTVSTKQINELRRTPGLPLWQRNYYERVIRNDRELNAIRQYIIENPLKWDVDLNNPACAISEPLAGRSRTTPTHVTI